MPQTTSQKVRAIFSAIANALLKRQTTDSGSKAFTDTGSATSFMSNSLRFTRPHAVGASAPGFCNVPRFLHKKMALLGVVLDAFRYQAPAFCVAVGNVERRSVTGKHPARDRICLFRHFASD